MSLLCPLVRSRRSFLSLILNLNTVTFSLDFQLVPSLEFGRALGSTQPPIQWVRVAVSPGVKRPGRDADNSPPSSAEVKNTWSYTSTPPYLVIA
jgi:hypothetical protein